MREAARTAVPATAVAPPSGRTGGGAPGGSGPSGRPVGPLRAAAPLLRTARLPPDGHRLPVDGPAQPPRPRARRAAAAQFASAITWSQSVAQVRLISRETCIWEMPSCSAIRLCVMSQKNRM